MLLAVAVPLPGEGREGRRSSSLLTPLGRGGRPGSALPQGWVASPWGLGSAGDVARPDSQSSHCGIVFLSHLCPAFCFYALLWLCFLFVGRRIGGEVCALKGFSIMRCTLLSWREGPSEASFLSLFHVKSPV